MAFGSLLITNPTPTVLNPFLTARPSPTPGNTAAAPATQSTPSPDQSAAAPSSAPARSARAGGAHGGGDGGSAPAAAANTATLLETATVYTTTVAGKQYSGSVVESDGEYTASVPNLAGASATGATEQAAENNLNSRLDELV
jgi:predicted RNase H-like HicB family nuclease